jgi:hypothetical protein
MRPATWPAPCPVCHSLSDMTCFSGGWGTKLPEVHKARLQGERGPWTRIYDEKCRDGTLKFNAHPYRRAA